MNYPTFPDTTPSTLMFTINLGALRDLAWRLEAGEAGANAAADLRTEIDKIEQAMMTAATTPFIVLPSLRCDVCRVNKFTMEGGQSADAIRLAASHQGWRRDAMDHDHCPGCVATAEQSK